MINVGFILYALQPSTGLVINHLPPQGGIIVIIASGIGGCLVAVSANTKMVRQLTLQHPVSAPVRHMSLTGLPDNLVQDIAKSTMAPTRFVAVRTLFDLDMTPCIRDDAKLRRLHASAEVFDPFAEAFFWKLQVSACL